MSPWSRALPVTASTIGGRASRRRQVSESSSSGVCNQVNHHQSVKTKPVDCGFRLQRCDSTAALIRKKKRYVILSFSTADAPFANPVCGASFLRSWKLTAALLPSEERERYRERLLVNCLYKSM